MKRIKFSLMTLLYILFFLMLIIGFFTLRYSPTIIAFFTGNDDYSNNSHIANTVATISGTVITLAGLIYIASGLIIWWWRRGISNRLLLMGLLLLFYPSFYMGYYPEEGCTFSNEPLPPLTSQMRKQP